MKSTIMPREMKCIVCGYTQKDYVSYYKHAKAWKANHDLDKCLSIRRSQNAFTEMFSQSLDSLAKLTIIK